MDLLYARSSLYTSNVYRIYQNGQIYKIAIDGFIGGLLIGDFLNKDRK